MTSLTSTVTVVYNQSIRLHCVNASRIHEVVKQSCMKFTEECVEVVGKKNIKDVRVVIVGAGMAGVSAAQRLHELGFRHITVLEATDRVGGRIHTSNFGKEGTNCTIELGAQYIHGNSRDNSLYKLAQDKNILNSEILEDLTSGKVVNEHGHEIDRKLADDILDIGYELESKAETLHKRRKVLHGKDANLFYFFDERAKKVAAKYPTEQQEDVKSVFNYYISLMRFDNGNHLINMNTDNFGQYQSLGDDEDVLMERGFQTLLDAIVKDMPDSYIKLNTPVTIINWSKSAPVVTTANGQELVADHVIVTCSLGYLQEHHDTLFEPKLPAKKSQALGKVGFGTVNKIFLYYETPFWTKGQGTIGFAWTDKNRDINSLSEWYKCIHGFAELHNNDHVLFGSIVGEEGRYMEGLDKEEIKTVCAKQIRRFLNDLTIPDPTDVLITKWYNNRWTLGSYAYMMNESTDCVRRTLGAPLKKDNPAIFFAGEAFHLNRFSTADGARSSGLRKATDIYKLYSRK